MALYSGRTFCGDLISDIKLKEDVLCSVCSVMNQRLYSGLVLDTKSTYILC